MASRKTLSKITPPKRATPVDVVELMCERYWNAFRTGYCAVGGRPEDYPTWKKATDPVKEETRRCMRHAVEALEGVVIESGAMSAFFPNGPKARSLRQIQNDAQFVVSQRLARLGE
jgi:hypothetical protein